MASASLGSAHTEAAARRTSDLVWYGSLGVLLLVCWLLYHPVLGHPVDPSVWEHMRGVGVTEGGVYRDLLSADRCLAVSPLLQLAIGVVLAVCGQDAWWLHATGLALHAAASVLLAIAVTSLGQERAVGAVAGFLFACGVAHFQAVHTVLAFPHLLCLDFALLFVVQYAGTAVRVRPARVIVACLLLVAGSLSHPSCLLVVPFCLSVSWLRGGPRDRRTLIWILGVPGAVALTVASAVGMHHSLALAEPSARGFWSLAADGLHHWCRLVSTCHWLPLVPILPSGTWEYAVGVPSAVLLGICCFSRPTTYLPWALWAILALGLSLPVDPVYEHQIPLGPSRFLHLAAAGLAVLAALLLVGACRRLGTRVPAATWLLLLASLGGLFVLSRAALRRAEAVDWYLMAWAYHARGANAEAMEYLNNARALGPDTIPGKASHILRAHVAANLGRDVEVVLQDALELFPADPELNLYQLVVQSASHDSLQAGSAREELILVRGSLPSALSSLAAVMYQNRGLSAFSRGDLPTALQALEGALSLTPDRRSVLRKMAVVLAKMNRYGPAARAMEESLGDGLADADALVDLAMLYMEAHDPARATRALERALRLDPGNARVRAGSASLRGQTGSSK